MKNIKKPITKFCKTCIYFENMCCFYFERLELSEENNSSCEEECYWK